MRLPKPNVSHIRPKLNISPIESCLLGSWKPLSKHTVSRNAGFPYVPLSSVSVGHEGWRRSYMVKKRPVYTATYGLLQLPGSFKQWDVLDH